MPDRRSPVPGPRSPAHSVRLQEGLELCDVRLLRGQQAIGQRPDRPVVPPVVVQMLERLADARIIPLDGHFRDFGG